MAHGSHTMEQECIKLWHHRRAGWMESVILVPALEPASLPWKGEGTGIPEVVCDTVSGLTSCGEGPRLSLG